MDSIKLNWWEGYLNGNLHKSATDSILLTDFNGKLLEFSSIQEVYEIYIKAKNEIIWEPYYNTFTKIFVELIVEAVIKICGEIPITERVGFITESINEIKKQQILEEYTSYKINEHLNYYKSMLEFSLSETAISAKLNKENLFQVITENDKISYLKDCLISKKFDAFFKAITTIFSSIPYQVFSAKEAWFHSIFHVILHLLSNKTKSEDATNLGRIDLYTEVENIILIFEFKLNDPIKAIQQIRDKKYFEKYTHTKKEIYLVGVSFSTKRKNINKWKVEKL